MSNVVYEAAVHTRTISYTNFKGESRTVELYFALDPIQLMRVIAAMPTKKNRSKNPARSSEVEQFDDEQMLKFLVDLADNSAGFPSEDGESFEQFEGFSDSLAGKAFITKLLSSDSEREEFSRKVVVEPFRSFVAFAESDNTNTPADIQQFKTMLGQMERIFNANRSADESYEDRRARLQKELDELAGSGDE